MSSVIDNYLPAPYTPGRALEAIEPDRSSFVGPLSYLHETQLLQPRAIYSPNQR
jgi:hypothetical protein